MNKKQKKNLFAVLVIVFSIIILFDLYLYLSRKDEPEISPNVASDKPVQKTSYIKEIAERPHAMLSFTPVISIKYKVNEYKEIHLDEGEAFDPMVSPDGSQILFIQKKGSKNILTIVDLLSNKILPLDLGLDNYSNPSWNPEDAKIVFAGVKKSAYEIYTYDIQNKKLFQVTNNSSRKKYWPRFSLYKFSRYRGDSHYRIVYVSEDKGRKDIWWIRENGEDERPLTVPSHSINEYKNPEQWKGYEVGPPEKISIRGGDFPEWSPSGDVIIYRTERDKYSALYYDSYKWWEDVPISLPTVEGILLWSPNQGNFLAYNPAKNDAYLYSKDNLEKERILKNKILTSSPSFFPDGKGFAYTYKKEGKSILAIEPFDDPLGDVVNIWMYPYKKSQKEKLARNHLLFLYAGYDKIYSIYESEFYHCGGPTDVDAHARPYLVTSDAVLETFYATFAALLSYVERVEFANALKEFAAKGLEAAREKKSSGEVGKFFLVGLTLLQPDMAKDASIEVKQEIERIQKASGSEKSFFGQKIRYDDFLIRGKYERDKDLQRYFQALKWFQTFKFDLKKEEDRKWVAEILDVVNTPEVYKSIERINLILKDIIGESRYYGPLSLKAVSKDSHLPEIRSALPWIQVQDSFRLFPSIYTLDAFIFDELITHLDKAETVGTGENPRLLPVGMDIMAVFGSNEAKRILIDELKEGRFENYLKRLDEVTKKVRQLSDKMWEQNLYQAWLNMLNTLIVNPPSNAPDFSRSKAWQRKELNTALSSWVNLRYETVAYVEQVGAECGEMGYEQINIGSPRGYVEPNPLFFKKLNDGFGQIADRFKDIIKDNDLRKAVLERIENYRKHIKILETIAQKELDNVPLTDNEYLEILYIGRTIEHFILIMNSMGSKDDALSNPDSIIKIVDVQNSPFGEILYEAIGQVNEINVIVPYFGRRQIVKGPVYSYYEFRSSEVWNNEKWRQKYQTYEPPIWIREYYDGKALRLLPNSLAINP